MARRFMRRKPKVLWLPVVGNDNSDIPEEENWVAGPAGVLSVPHTGAIIFDATPVTFDYSDPPSTEQGVFDRSLQDLTSGNNYRLRRIVGKIHAACQPQSNTNNNYPPLEVAAGFMVNRTDDSGNLINAGGFGNEQAASPLAQDATQDPWIWRRKWMLSPNLGVFFDDNISTAVALAQQHQGWPATNAGYGSVADGPHIDQKTARVISNQERLFFWIAARVRNDNPSGEFNTLSWNLDIRILASLRMNQGNRRNASR